MDEKKVNPEAVAIRFNKIIKVGRAEEMESVMCSRTEIIDLEGKTMLPGFIDPHIHSLFCTFKKNWVNLGPFVHRTREDAKRALVEAISRHTEPDVLLTCFLYDPLITPGEFDVSRKGLDKLSESVGIYILESNAHVAHLNSYAFKLMGIDKDTKNPEHGTFARDENGELTGEVYESAVDVFRTKFPRVSSELYLQCFL
jgi:predicted amidohydrolase YtcJ